MLPGNHPVTLIDNTANLISPCQAYQNALDKTTADVIIYLHDDVTVYDPGWLERLTRPFGDPQIVATGFGGATSLGRPDLYRKPYSIWNLARGGYASNATDAEVHGERFTGDRRVAVLEQFCMAVRVSWLRQRGGWPVEHCSHHMLDAFIACEAARDDKEVWQCSVECHHAGGTSSTLPKYREAKWLIGGSMEADHQAPHQWIFDCYADCLPITV